MGNLRNSQWRRWGFGSSGMWRCVSGCDSLRNPWRRRHHYPSKRWKHSPNNKASHPKRLNPI